MTVEDPHFEAETASDPISEAASFAGRSAILRQLVFVAGGTEGLSRVTNAMREGSVDRLVDDLSDDAFGNYDDTLVNATKALADVMAFIAAAIAIKNELKDSVTFTAFVQRVREDASDAWRACQRHASVVAILSELAWSDLKNKASATATNITRGTPRVVLRLAATLVSMFGTSFLAAWVVASAVSTANYGQLWALVGIYVFSAFLVSVTREPIIASQIRSAMKRVRDSDWFQIKSSEMPIDPRPGSRVQMTINFLVAKGAISKKTSRLIIHPSTRPAPSQMIATRAGMNDYVLLIASPPDTSKPSGQYGAMRVMWTLAHELSHSLSPVTRFRQAALLYTVLLYALCSILVALYAGTSTIIAIVIIAIGCCLFLRALIIETIAEVAADSGAMYHIMYGMGAAPHLVRQFLEVEGSAMKRAGAPWHSVRRIKLLVRRKMLIPSWTRIAAGQEFLTVYVDSYSKVVLGGAAVALAAFGGVLYSLTDTIVLASFIAGAIAMCGSAASIAWCMLSGKQLDNLIDDLPPYELDAVPK